MSPTAARGRRARAPGIALLVAAVLAVAATAACGGDGEGADRGDGTGTTTSPGGGTGDGSDDPGGGAGDDRGRSGAGAGAALADVELSLTPVAEADSPTALVTRPGTEQLYVAEREGRVRPLAVSGTGADRSYELGDPILDISDDVVADVERGLLDITFSPDGSALYVSYSLAPGGDTRVDEYRMAGDEVEVGSRRQVFAHEQPAANHNGGDVEFGPEGFLFLGLGDGGGAGDPQDNGQDPHALLGSVLRIDPARPGGGRAYGIPTGNPFADGEGGAPEVWLYGVRNPWRITFDPATGDLWLADVGQAEWEEVDLLPASSGRGAGANLGWDEMEGSHPFEGGEAPEGAIAPVFEYSHDEGCSITGGVVYRDGAVAGLDGAYLFADYCQGVLRAVRAEGGEAVDHHAYEDATLSEPVSFGVGPAGDAYMVSLGGTIARIDPAG